MSMMSPQMQPVQPMMNANWNGPVFNQATGMPPMGPQQMQQTQIMPSIATVQQQGPQSPTLPAKVITKIEDIKANDVSMDGTISMFLMNDLSSVILRQWNGRGDMDELRFVREETPTPPNQNDILALIMQRLDNIEKAVKKSTYKPRYNKNHQKEESGNAV